MMTAETATLPAQRPPSDDENDDAESVNSADEALCAMLGLDSLGVVQEADASSSSNTKKNDGKIEKPNPHQDDDENDNDTATTTTTILHSIPSPQEFEQNESLQSSLRALHETYLEQCVVELPIRIADTWMRQITNELIWSGNVYPSDKSYETVRSLKKGNISEQRVLTRLEHFVHGHDGWGALTRFIGQCMSVVCQEPMVLFKEKLNIKPPGGSGFAPHLDTPSLRVALGETGPQEFLTVMVAIDPMTVANGCLRVSKGRYTEDNCVETIQPNPNGNPDADGRAGAIPLEIANNPDICNFQDLTCPGGSIFAFDGRTPHRSAANASPFARRAVFLTYNPAREGSFRDAYYQHMEDLRNEWRSKMGLLNGGVTGQQQQQQLSEDEQAEMDALATIPRI